jgi:hypothetical protein
MSEQRDVSHKNPAFIVSGARGAKRTAIYQIGVSQYTGSSAFAIVATGTYVTLSVLTKWDVGAGRSLDSHQLLRRGRLLESATLGWNIVGVLVLAIAAITARSVALAGFGLDSMIEIGASTIVLWALADVAEVRQRRAMRLIGFAFVALALYLAIQSTVVLFLGFHPRHSPLGIVWTAMTAVVMFLLATGKATTGAALDNSVLRTEGKVTLIDGILATAVLVGLFSTLSSGGGGQIRPVAMSSSTTPSVRPERH